MAQRLVAKRVRITDLSNGKFFYGSKEELKPSYIITPFGDIVSRVNICGTVTGKFDNDSGTYSNVTVDDGTGAISVRVFGDISILQGIDAGDVVAAIGKIKEYNGERYIGGEIVKKVTDNDYESYRKLELLARLVQQKKVADELKNIAKNASQDELRSYASGKYGMDEQVLNAILGNTVSEIDYKSKVLELIVSMDGGNGAEISKIFQMSKLPENAVEAAISELIEEGSLYEPVVGKLKKV